MFPISKKIKKKLIEVLDYMFTCITTFYIYMYCQNMLCAVKLRVLGLMAYWYTGSAFHQIPQSYLNDVHLVPPVVLRDNELLTKVPIDIDTRRNILTTRQTPVSVRALIGWLQVQVMDFFFFHLLFKHALCS